MYLMTPRTILFREEHSTRVLVPRVDIISAPGISEPGVFRRGTAQALVTGSCVFRFDRASARFALASVHPGETAGSIRAATGFDYDTPEGGAETQPPSAEELAACADRSARRCWRPIPRSAVGYGTEGPGRAA